MYESVRQITECMCDWHHSISDEWLNTCKNLVNLKKRLVSEIELDGEIYRNVIDYSRYLNVRSQEIIQDLASLKLNEGCCISQRIKAENSIQDKIRRYKTRKEQGKIPIKKCLNDLFGVRLIGPGRLGKQELDQFLGENLKHRKLSCKDSSKNGYRALHVYIMKDNLCFPWELQIWCNEDEENNKKNHHFYKQEYTKWEETYKKGGNLE